MLCNCLAICFLALLSLFQNVREPGAKRYVKDHREANTIQLVVAMFWPLLLLNRNENSPCRSEGEFPCCSHFYFAATISCSTKLEFFQDEVWITSASVILVFFCLFVCLFDKNDKKKTNKHWNTVLLAKRILNSIENIISKRLTNFYYEEFMLITNAAEKTLSSKRKN